METVNHPTDILPGRRPALPGMLNVLTILTLIGSGLGYLTSLYNFFANNDPDKQIEKIREGLDKAPDSGFMHNMLESSIVIIQKSYDNRYLLFATTLLFTTLCVIGALQMRKLKRSGYFFYITGELAPIVLMAGLFGGSLLAAFNLLLVALVAIVFVILYSTQLKYLQVK